MKFVFSNIFFIIFCKYFSLQEYSNSKIFLNSVSFNDDKTLVLSNLMKGIICIFDFTVSLFNKKLPLITENGGILVIKFGD